MGGGRNTHFVKHDEGNGWGREGYMAAKIRKLESQFNSGSSNARLSSIFHGVAIHVNGYTIPSSDELKKIMAQHGGQYHAYYSRTRTTHVIATNLPRAKVKELKPEQNVVSPQWILDSLQEKCLQPLQNYRIHYKTLPNQTLTTMLITKTCDKSMNDCTKSSCTTSASCDNEKLFPNTSSVSKQAGIAATADSNFLSEFYSHSRLHFLSTFKNKLVDYVRTLQQTKTPLEQLDGYMMLQNLVHENHEMCDLSISQNENFIMHIDMDCFFASVALLHNPHLKGHPVAITHSSGGSRGTGRPGVDFNYEKQHYENLLTKGAGPNTSVKDKFNKVTTEEPFSAAEIACVNYEARKYGLKNGMFFGKAKEICPNLKTVPYDFDSYKETSEKLYSALAAFTHSIEAVSCDEALLDITEIVQKTGLKTSVISTEIRKHVTKVTGCNCSAGIGPNITLARMATRVGKPNGQYQVISDDAKEFMRDKLVKELPGVGRSTSYRLHELGILTCYQLQNIALKVLQDEFGIKNGTKLQDLSMGIDTRQVNNVKERKSVSADVNYVIRLANEEEAKTFFKNLSIEVTKRLMEAHKIGRKITLKLKVRKADAPVESVKFGGHGVCDSFSKSGNLPVNCDLKTIDQAIYTEAWKLLKSLYPGNVCELRGIGIQITNLCDENMSSSRSAIFLKNFISKMNASTSDMGMNTSLNKSDNENDTALTHITMDNPSEGNANASFLSALPEDIRREVETNMDQQKKVLHQIHLGTPAINTDETVESLVQPKIKSMELNKKGNKPATKKTSQSRKESSKMRPSPKKSPNKLITDLFPVIHSPKKTKLFPTNQIPLKQHKLPGDTGEPILLDSNSCDSPVSVTNGDSVESGQFTNEDKNTISSENPTKVHEFPVVHLGGAVDIVSVREIIRQWVDSYHETGPLESDCGDILQYIVDLATKLRDLRMAHLVIKHLSRCIKSSIQKYGSNQVNIKEWLKSYKSIIAKFQQNVENSYNGAQLKLEPLRL